MKNLFQQLIWPAAAGNVAWAFFTVAVGEKWCDVGVGARLTVLLLLAVYLIADWKRLIDSSVTFKPKFWIADAFHSASVVVFAIATQMNKAGLEWYLMAVLFVGVIGHLSGVWEPTVTVERRWLKRILLAATNALGLVIIGLGFFTESCLKSSGWDLPLAVGLVLLFWFPVRNCVLPKLN